jgi:membrane protein implicated in regulation of membrane protease activity
MAFGVRGGKSTGRFLEWKIRLFFVGAVILMVGIAREIDLLVILAVAVLAVAFVLRFFERPDPVDEDLGEDGEDDGAAETR